MDAVISLSAACKSPYFFGVSIFHREYPDFPYKKLEKSGFFALILLKNCHIIYRHFEESGESLAEYCTG
ncbi:MAG: hypothetical protein ACI3W5_05555 [Faecousia sp.]